ncbi:MAG: hypothetical protein QM758_08370 [Armatimonas sp.]
MDRVRYGRRLTFLNAYFSLAITLIPLLWMTWILCVMQKFNPIWTIWITRGLLFSAWSYSRQVIELRAGVPVEDKRSWHVGSLSFPGALISGLGLVVLLPCLLGFWMIMLSEQAPQPVSRAELWSMEMTLSLVGIWASLWLNRAAWEWRVNQGKVHPSERVERAEEGKSVLPHTEAGMRRYIRELTWLIRIVPWVSGLLVLLPACFLSSYSWTNLAGGTVFSIFLLSGVGKLRKQARQDRDACRRELKARMALVAPIVTTVPNESKPLYQWLRP